MGNDDNGFGKAPERYMGTGRETVDVMRDSAFGWARDLCYEASANGVDAPADAQGSIADVLFAFACETHALKYENRAGRKGDPDGDAEKARWWRQMQAHVMFGEPDPRSGRPGFVPYRRDGGER